jgi:hypothetical protein
MASYRLNGTNTPEFQKYRPLSLGNVKTNDKDNGTSPTSKGPGEKVITAIKSMIDVIPNSFSRHTTIRYVVPDSDKVSIKLYNTTKKLIGILADDYLPPGVYTMKLHTRFLPKGLYFLKYENAGTNSEVELNIR